MEILRMYSLGVGWLRYCDYNQNITNSLIFAFSCAIILCVKHLNDMRSISGIFFYIFYFAFKSLSR